MAIVARTLDAHADVAGQPHRDRRASACVRRHRGDDRCRPHRRRRPRPHRARGRRTARWPDRHPGEQRRGGDVRAAVGDAAEAAAHHVRGQRARAARSRAGRAARHARTRRGVDRQRVERDRDARARTAVPHGRSCVDHGHVRRVEGGAQPGDQRTGARALGSWDPREHRRTPRRGDERGRRSRSPVT